eukprot:15468637-Alexandrium_andersonii.AAC.1
MPQGGNRVLLGRHARWSATTLCALFWQGCVATYDGRASVALQWPTHLMARTDELNRASRHPSQM